MLKECLTVSAAAVGAAVSAAAGLGVACAEPEVLADGANIVCLNSLMRLTINAGLVHNSTWLYGIRIGWWS